MYCIRVDVIEINSDTLYAKPWTRIGPFLGGGFCGWILYKIKGKPVKLNQCLVALYWIVTFVIFIFTIFMTYKRDLMVVLCALMWSLGKYVFGLYIGSIVVMCHFGYGSKSQKQNSVYKC